MSPSPTIYTIAVDYWFDLSWARETLLCNPVDISSKSSIRISVLFFLCDYT